MRFIFVTASGRERESNGLLNALVESGVKDMLVSYFFLAQQKNDKVKMYARLGSKS